MGSTAAILTRSLTKTYGPNVALCNLDLEVQRGEVMGCLGPNGAGKTTTIRLLLGLINPSAGRCEVLGSTATDRPWRLTAISIRSVGR